MGKPACAVARNRHVIVDLLALLRISSCYKLLPAVRYFNFFPRLIDRGFPMLNCKDNAVYNH